MHTSLRSVFRWSSLCRAVILTAAIIGLPTMTDAQDVFWTGSVSDDWATEGNWSTGTVPATFEFAFIDNGGTAVVRSIISEEGDLNSVDEVHVEDGTLDIVENGELTVFFGFSAGSFGSTGTVNHSGGILRVADGGDGSLHVGAMDSASAGVGEYNISGDAQFIQQPSFDANYFARGAGSSATVNIADNALMSFTNQLEIGADGGDADVFQTGGRVEVVPVDPPTGAGSPNINIGNNAGTASYSISGGELISTNNLNVAEGGSTAVVNQTGGLVQVDYSLRILSQGTYNLSGGTLLANNAAAQADNERLVAAPGDWQVNEIGVGNQGELNISETGRLVLHERTQVHGNVNQSGGELHLLAVPDRSHEADLNIGDGGTTNEYNLSGGTMNVEGGINIGLWSNNTDSRFNVSGGQVTAGSIGVGAGTDPAATEAGINAGTMNMTGGDVQVNNELWIGVGNKSLGTMNLSGGTVNVGGIINVAAGFRWNNADDEQFLNQGVLNLSGDAELRGGTMLVGGRNVIDDLGTGNGVVNQSGGSLFLTGGLEIGVGPPGLPGGSESTGIYNLTGGLLDLGGSDISFGAGEGEFEFTGGVLRNVANVNFSLANGGGALEPGASAGVTNINGDYFVAASTAALNIELGGLVQGAEYDLLNVTGTANLGGILNVTLIGGGSPVGDTNGDGVVNIDDLNNVRNNFGVAGPPTPVGDTNGDGVVNIDDLNNVRNNFGVMGGGFSPADGDVFEILTAGAGRDGEFETVNLPGLGPGLAWNVSYLPNSVELEVLATPGAVPEPSALLLVAFGATLLSLRRRRLRR